MAEVAEASKPTSRSEPFRCPYCGGTEIIRDYKSGETVCATCGFVIEGKSFDRGPEWRAFDQKEREKKSRAGPPRTETIHDRGLSTRIDWKDRDAKGNTLSPNQRRKAYEMRKWDKRSKFSRSRDRTLSGGFIEIGRMSSLLGLPESIREKACKTYREATERGMIRGRSVDGVTSAIVYIECRKAGIPRTLEEVAEVSYVDKKEIDQDQRYLEKELAAGSGTMSPAQLIPRFGSELGVPGKIRSKATELTREVERRSLESGKSPSGIAVAALYIACRMANRKKTQKEIAEVADITEVTLRNLYKEIVKKLGIPKREGKKRLVAEIGEWSAEEGTETGEAEARKIKVEGVKYENVVSSVTFKDTEFDLKKLVEKLDAYKPSGFPGVSYHLEGTEATFLIFESGKANCVGSSSPEGAIKAPKLLAEKLRVEGFEVDPNPEVVIRNMVIQADFGVPIDLEAFHGSPHDTSYDPGSFPGLQLVLDEPDVDFLIFASGRVILHAGREEDVEPAFEGASEILQEFALGSSWSNEVEELTTWIGKNPRYLKVLKAVKNHPKTPIQMAKDFDLKRSTVKEYISQLARRSAMKHKENGETQIVITERGVDTLEVLS